MSTWVCLTIGGTSAVQPGMSIALPVDVEQAAGFWAVRTPAGTLAMRLDAQGGSLSGTVEGEATSGDRTVVIGTSRQHLSPALVSASAGPTAFTGDIAGDVAFIDGAVTHSCSSNGWSLTPR